MYLEKDKKKVNVFVYRAVQQLSQIGDLNGLGKHPESIVFAQNFKQTSSRDWVNNFVDKMHNAILGLLVLFKHSISDLSSSKHGMYHIVHITSIRNKSVVCCLLQNLPYFWNTIIHNVSENVLNVCNRSHSLRKEIMFNFS